MNLTSSKFRIPDDIQKSLSLIHISISEPPEDTPGVAVPYVCIGEYFIMCERASLLERLLILITGRIYISVIPDKIVPPISCTTIFPFKAVKNIDAENERRFLSLIHI